jgi:hypothetical protein
MPSLNRSCASIARPDGLEGVECAAQVVLVAAWRGDNCEERVVDRRVRPAKRTAEVVTDQGPTEPLRVRVRNGRDDVCVDDEPGVRVSRCGR